MLPDPLTVKGLDLSAHTAITIIGSSQFALIDLAPGRTVRKSPAVPGTDAPATLTIAHSVSKENGPVPTERALIRLDVDGLRPTVGGTPGLKAFAYLVVGGPKVAYDNSDSIIDKLSLVENLLGVIAVNTATSVLSELNLGRIINGEP